MTKEELENEAEEWLCNNLHSASEEDFIKAMVDIAEPREKRIEELIALINAERGRQEKCDDVHLRTIAELEKENAELKKLKRECETSICRAEYQYNYEQLTKAKEIIKTFLGFAEVFGYSPSMDKFITETEQFLSEVEK